LEGDSGFEDCLFYFLEDLKIALFDIFAFHLFPRNIWALLQHLFLESLIEEFAY